MKGKNKKKVYGGIIGIVLLLAIVGGTFFYFSGDSSNKWGDNGIYNAQTGECLPRTGSTSAFFQCCFNYDGQQVDCRDSQKLMGVSPMAIYQGTPGIGSIIHGVKVTNTGNVGMEAYIESATWTATGGASPTFLNTAWNSIKGIAYKKAVAIGQFQTWSTPMINVQESCTNTSQTYSLNMQVKGTTMVAGTEVASTLTKTTSFTCTRESVSFDVDITL